MPVTIILRDPLVQLVHPTPVVRSPVPRKDTSTRGHSNGCVDAWVETTTWPFFTRHTKESVEKGRKFCIGWDNEFWLTWRNRLLLHNRSRTNCVWNPECSLGELLLPRPMITVNGSLKAPEMEGLCHSTWQAIKTSQNIGWRWEIAGRIIKEDDNNY